jgi:3-isopropylmalate/(R)-2-methylmalate dehydratase small subunit
MQAFTILTGPAAALPLANIDTDVIIRIERLTSLKDEQLGPYAFEALRFRADGSEYPQFVLNLPAFREAPILLAGPNFGCGSSREGAVTALMARGIRSIIAPSYGDIFYNNCFQNGLLPITLAESQIALLAGEAAHGEAFTVDLQRRTITTPKANVYAFTIDPLRREGLLHGLDDIGLTFKDDALIRDWQQADRMVRAWAWPASRAGMEQP